MTGAASGIGRAVADYLEAQLCTIVRLDLDAEYTGKPFDVANESHWDALDVPDAVGLVHAAGIRTRGTLADMTVDDFDDVMGTNARGTFLALRWAARLARSREKLGQSRYTMSVVTLSSAVVDRLPPGQAAYNASKSAVTTLTRSAALEFAQFGIRVNTIAAGSIRTPLTEAGWSDEEHAAKMRAQIPVHRPGSPSEIATVAQFLLSDSSSYLTGSVITADGGWTL